MTPNPGYARIIYAIEDAICEAMRDSAPRPNALYFGRAEYCVWLAGCDGYRIILNSDEYTFYGCRVFQVDADSHFAIAAATFPAQT